GVHRVGLAVEQRERRSNRVAVLARSNRRAQVVARDVGSETLGGCARTGGAAEVQVHVDALGGLVRILRPARDRVAACGVEPAGRRLVAARSAAGSPTPPLPVPGLARHGAFETEARTVRVQPSEHAGAGGVEVERVPALMVAVTGL